KEIQYFVDSILNESFPLYQASAFLMAIFFRGLNDDETFYLFEAMLGSGSPLDLSSISGKKIDKHSTGGVGDKTSLIIAPLVASCGAYVPMISGRGLGHTGGTLDKLESIPGFQVRLGTDEFKKILNYVGCAMGGQTEDIAPADRILYSIRDVTGTVECLPLIASSIMSKKLSENLDALVLDVKFGSGAFMKTYEKALELATVLVNLGQRKKVKTRALLTNMDQPLGNTVGNALEVIECIEVLNGQGDHDLINLSLHLGAHMLELAGLFDNFEDAMKGAKKSLSEKSALKVFRNLVERQGGDASFIENPGILLEGVLRYEIESSDAGFIQSINTEHLGQCCAQLGSGRSKIEDKIDPGVGVVLHKKIGDHCDKGESLMTVYHRDNDKFRGFVDQILKSFKFGNEPVAKPKLISEIIGD
ncbi:MAG: thymidine phosphorylase, partial [Deltaproteobacteria bacterium]|nr:thymidine phosphorylase [Deltaproteobacteria bacterium]